MAFSFGLVGLGNFRFHLFRIISASTHLRSDATSRHIVQRRYEEETLRDLQRIIYLLVVSLWVTSPNFFAVCADETKSRL